MKSYQNLLKDVLDNGRPHQDRTGVGTLSVFGRQWRHDMRDGFPLLTTKKVPLRWVAEELFWFLSGSTDEKALSARGVDIWKEWATEEQCAKFGRSEGDLGPVYGHLWRNFGGTIGQGTDQITRLIEDIHQSPSSRRLIVSGWHAAESKMVALPPCHTAWQVKCYEDTMEMSLHLFARSIDSFLGLPFNIASYALLLSMIAHVTGYKPLELVISFSDLHIYNNHIDQVKEQLSREPYPLPTLKLNPYLRNGSLGALLGFRWSDIELLDYVSHSKISAEVAV